MAKWPWLDRKFNFDFPPEKFTDLLERLRGTPARLEERLRGVPDAVLSRRRGDGSWSIKQNVGHLIDLGYLPVQRIRQILAGETELVGADVLNPRTNAANHNERPIAELLAAFRKDRAAAVAEFEAIAPVDWSRAGVHPRLRQSMRIVDIVCFDSEHDDYHLGRIAELLREFGV